ncbi:hypothetical protein A1O1_06528 [Capronia coronata CBS 617.96]|uniref:Galactose oxidase n=1 Tax=Capronia coronata CBS 617.96 TaxID=1182541 RepID=W9Y0Z5_9EURO|nr:uncharacterized protein A1O1_06528 [Capronia coronata CBS 617.96]EXJ86158.1 hypothetical protein A1O1_06528 [Capronia coronata CBS 617.96]
MLRRLSLLLPITGLAAVVTPVVAQLPYNPTRIVPAKDGSVAYLFSPQPSSSQFALYALDTADNVSSSSTKTAISGALPFLSETESKAFVTIPDGAGIAVLAGDCGNPAEDLELWRFTPDDNEEAKNGSWSTLPLAAGDDSLGCNYLSAGFAFSPSASVEDASLYVFGGMCPTGTSSAAATWVSDAVYSNTMLTFAPDSTSNGSAPYKISMTGARAPPIAEAGLTITALTPTFSNTSNTNVSQQQNFVLLGGHTQTAFINMSQLAIFALPQESWAFVGVSPATVAGAQRFRTRATATTVEPRSGHTAILADDGSQIFVFGGWVGDINTPAQPQFIVLEVGQGYGGQGEWTWSTPTSASDPFPSGSGTGIYGHGAAMLPGGVMMVSGGYSIDASGSKSKRKRQPSDTLLFLNTTSLEWTSTYTNPYPSGSPPASPSASSSTTGLKSSERAGLGAGLGLGLAAAAGVAVVWLLYSRKLRAKRALREKEIRELALGAERYRSPTPPGETRERPGDGMRSASWNGIQERELESSGDSFPWAPVALTAKNGKVRLAVGAGRGESDASRYAERTGVQREVPSPTRGLRKNLVSRAPTGPGPFNQHPPGAMPGAVFRIDEEEEGSQAGSSKRMKMTNPVGDGSSALSDPFQDPAITGEPALQGDAAIQRKKEVESWVEDWQSAAETMSMSRSTSQAYSRTYSNLSQFRPPGSSQGRGSPEKSDRTGSNLSENSVMTTSSFQKSAGSTMSRSISQRSASAGYALFSGAAAAMSRVGNARQGPFDNDPRAGPARTPSNRSISLNIDPGRHPNPRDYADPSSSARTGWGRVKGGEDQALLNRAHQRQPPGGRGYQTLAETSSKDKYTRAGSLTGSGRRALTLLGSMRRVFTGTGSVHVHDRVTTFENQSSQSSPTKHSAQPEMTDAGLNRALSAGASFWQGKRGAKDWDNDAPGAIEGGSSTAVRRKPVPGFTLNDTDGELEDSDDDWDVETAVQKRVVQVMFTVPKEKLRVVNADTLSLLSSNQSEADHDEDKDRDQVKRMSSVREGDESHDPDDEATEGKGKGKEREY